MSFVPTAHPITVKNSIHLLLNVAGASTFTVSMVEAWSIQIVIKSRSIDTLQT
jgi:hypothetical protein